MKFPMLMKIYDFGNYLGWVHKDEVKVVMTVSQKGKKESRLVIRYKNKDWYAITNDMEECRLLCTTDYKVF